MENKRPVKVSETLRGSVTRCSSPVVLVGMSAREVQARDQLRELAAPHDATVAFLQVGDPSLSRELTRLADLGAERVVVVGVSLGTLAPAVSWLRRICGYWWRERPGHRPELEVGSSLAGDAAEVRALVGLTRPITGDGGGSDVGCLGGRDRAPPPGARLPRPAGAPRWGPT